MFVTNITIATSTGDTILFRLEEVFDAENYGIISLEDGSTKLLLPVRSMDIDQGNNTITLDVQFKDLTVYADQATFQRVRNSLMDLEQTDGKDRGNS